MVGKLTRLPAETQKALQLLACLGNVAEIAMLSIVLGTSAEQVQAALWEAVRQELVERLDGSYRFIHDRVQEAAYSLIPEASRAAAHLRIGRLLAAQTPPEQREEAIFEIVNQLNRGAALITARDEREQLAEFNLIAGKRAKASTAYASALTYLVAGTALLAEDCWERRHELIFALELDRAECEFLTGALTEAEQRLNVLSTRAADTVERADRRVSVRRPVHDPRLRTSAPLPSVSTTSGIWASTGRRIRRKRKRGANTIGSGRSSGAGRSRISLICP